MKNQINYETLGTLIKELYTDKHLLLTNFSNYFTIIVVNDKDNLVDKVTQLVSVLTDYNFTFEVVGSPESIMFTDNRGVFSKNQFSLINYDAGVIEV